VVNLACDYRVNETRSSISKFFHESVLSSLLKVEYAAKYAYGYEVLDLLEQRRKQKPKAKGDRYHTKEFGQALRYGQYAVVAVCANLGPPAKKTAAQAQGTVLSHWRKFEDWAEKQASNKAYAAGSSFDYVNYYKGSTINADLKTFNFPL
jgi:hypothetical protein